MKIKSVNIVGFRSYAYDGDGLFDFIGPSNEIANFVAIFGPNGFGKSSIYDAIEWSITNSISRFNRDSQRISNNAISLALNQKGVAQHILRNRYIDDEDPSFVVVETTIHPPFSRPVKKAKSGSRDYKFDPKETDPSTKHLSEIFLSQDAIDSFLKEERAESRYEKFMAAFGGDDELYRQKLAALKRTSRNEREKLSSQIEAIQPDLPESVQEDALTHVMHTLSRVAEHNLEFENVDLEFNAITNIENQNRILRYREDYTNRIANIQNSTQLVDIASSKIPEYSDIFSRIKSLEEERLLKVQHRDAMRTINNIHSDISILENSRNETLTLLNEGKLRKESISDFFKKKELLRSASIKIDQLRRSKTSLLGFIAESSSNKISKNSLLIETRQRRTKELEDLTQLPDVFINLKKIEDNLNSIGTAKTQLTESRSSLLKKQDIVLVRRQELMNTVIDKSISSEIVLKLSGSNEVSNQLEALRKDEIDVADRLKSYRDLLSQVASRDKEISAIVRMGSELLSHTHSDTCPLCSHRYESHEELFRRIHSSDGISNEKLSILKLIEDGEKKISLISEEISQCLFRITTLRNEKIAAMDEAIGETKSSIQKLDIQVADLDLQIKKLDEEKAAAVTKTMGLTRPLMQERLEQNIKDFTSTIEKIESEIAEIDEKITNFRNSIADFEGKIAHEDEIIINGATEQSYALISKYLKDNGVPDGQEQSFIESQIIANGEKYDGLIADIAQKHDQLKTIQDGLSKFDFPNDATLVNEKIESLDEKITAAKNTLKSIIDSIITAGASKYETEIVSVELITKTLRDLREKYDNERQTYVAILSTLDLLANQLELALKFSESSRLKERINLLERNISAHLDFEESLDEEYAEVEKRLINHINEFFYRDLINNIYSKIDPHPTFKTIDFTSVFPDNGDKPRLEIFLREEGGDPISPNFYFSAAQLNVLSLSIFLARALHVRHNGELVRTILIDDPIQSMDSINILSTIDLLRGISQKFDRQIILSTHDENFYELLKMKVPPSKFNSKFIRLSEHGKVEVSSTSPPQGS